MSTFSIIALIIAIVLPQLAGGFGALYTFQAIPRWYLPLKKPRLAPPNWVFGPVWTILYLLMGFASYLVWHAGEGSTLVWGALGLYLVQLVLNALWSFLFFGKRNPRIAFFEIIALWVSIAATIVAFAPLSSLAAVLLLPYLVWVSFAAYLNFMIWKLNAPHDAS